MKVLGLVTFCLIALALSAEVSSDSADEEFNEIDEYFFPEKFQALIFGTDFRNVSRRGRKLDEEKEDGKTGELDEVKEDGQTGKLDEVKEDGQTGKLEEVKDGQTGELDEMKEDGQTDELGRIIPGATSFFTRLALQVLMFKILRAIAQYFADLIVAELFAT